MRTAEASERAACQVGYALRRIRLARRRRQVRVAEAARISKTMLCGYETGRQLPSVPTLIRVLAALDCSVEEFGIHLGPWGAVR